MAGIVALCASDATALGAPPGGPPAGPLPEAPSGLAGLGLMEGAVLLAGALSLTALWWLDIIRPGSFTRLAVRNGASAPHACRNPARLRPGAWMTAALGILAAQVLGFAAITGLPAGVIGPEDSMRRETLTSGAAIGFSAMVGVLVVAMLRTVGGPGSGLEWGLRGTRRALASLQAAVLGLLAVLPLCHGAAAISTLIATWAMGEAPDRIAHKTLDRLLDGGSDPWRWGVIAVVVLGAPLAEELLYRMGLQSALASLTARAMPDRISVPAAPDGTPRDTGAGRWTAVLAASAVFALIHAVGGGPVPIYALPPLMVLAVGLGVAYERTGSLFVPIAMHAGFNAWNILLALWTSGG